MLEHAEAAMKEAMDHEAIQGVCIWPTNTPTYHLISDLCPFLPGSIAMYSLSRLLSRFVPHQAQVQGDSSSLVLAQHEWIDITAGAA